MNFVDLFTSITEVDKYVNSDFDVSTKTNHGK